MNYMAPFVENVLMRKPSGYVSVLVCSLWSYPGETGGRQCALAELPSAGDKPKKPSKKESKQCFFPSPVLVAGGGTRSQVWRYCSRGRNLHSLSISFFSMPCSWQVMSAGFSGSTSSSWLVGLLGKINLEQYVSQGSSTFFFETPCFRGSLPRTCPPHVDVWCIQSAGG